MGTRLTGKNGKIKGVLARISVTSDQAMARANVTNPLLRTIIGTLTRLNVPEGIHVDTVNNEIFVLNYGGLSITVYTRTASGDVVPSREIKGGLTQILGATGLHATATEIFVADPTAVKILVFSRTDNGNVAPLRVLTGAATALNSPADVYADTVNSELFVSDNANHSVKAYTLTANGNTAPLRTLVGAATNMVLPDGIWVDTVNNELVVSNNGNSSITVFSRTASGNTAPTREINGGLTGLNQPEGIAVDTTNNEIVVANTGANTIAVFSRTASGNVAPVRVFSGLDSGLNVPADVSIDLVNDEIVVANNTGNKVTVYTRPGTGLSLIKYTFQSLWNPNKFPVVKKNAVVVSNALFTVDFINGMVTFLSPNLAGDSITVSAIEYVTLQDIADIYSWALDLKVDTVDVTAFQDVFHQKLSTFKGWTATAEGYKTSGYWFQSFQDAKEFYVEFYTDAVTAERLIGAAFVNWNAKVSHDAAVTETLTFEGTGNIDRYTA